MLTPTTDLLHAAAVGGYALGAFNVYNLEGVKAVMAAAETTSSPVMLQLHPAAVEHGGRPLLALCLEAARVSSVPTSVHLDHSSSAEMIQWALSAGLTSVMVDGSHYPYAGNLSFTREMTLLAHRRGATVEAELGRIGGTEDNIQIAPDDARLTDPAQAAQFVTETGIDALAVCIGNVHGHYAGEPFLDFARLEAIRDCVTVPLVLHGASGLPDSMIRESIRLGVCKFNVNTEVREAYIEALRKAVAFPKSDLIDLMQNAERAMQAIIEEKLRLFGSAGRAQRS